MTVTSTKSHLGPKHIMSNRWQCSWEEIWYYLIPTSSLPQNEFCPSPLKPSVKLKSIFPTWRQISSSNGKIHLIWSRKLFCWKIIVWKFQRHFAEECNFSLSPSSLLLWKRFSSKHKKKENIQTFRRNHSDFTSQNNLNKKRHEKLQAPVFYSLCSEQKG